MYTKKKTLYFPITVNKTINSKQSPNKIQDKLRNSINLRKITKSAKKNSPFSKSALKIVTINNNTFNNNTEISYPTIINHSLKNISPVKKPELPYQTNIKKIKSSYVINNKNILNIKKNSVSLRESERQTLQWFFINDVDINKRNFYEKKTIIIQAAFRGYLIRKKIINKLLFCGSITLTFLEKTLENIYFNNKKKLWKFFFEKLNLIKNNHYEKNNSNINLKIRELISNNNELRLKLSQFYIDNNLLKEDLSNYKDYKTKYDMLLKKMNIIEEENNILKRKNLGLQKESKSKNEKCFNDKKNIKSYKDIDFCIFKKYSHKQIFEIAKNVNNIKICYNKEKIFIEEKQNKFSFLKKEKNRKLKIEKTKNVNILNDEKVKKENNINKLLKLEKIINVNILNNEKVKKEQNINKILKIEKVVNVNVLNDKKLKKESNNNEILKIEKNIKINLLNIKKVKQENNINDYLKIEKNINFNLLDDNTKKQENNINELLKIEQITEFSLGKEIINGENINKNNICFNSSRIQKLYLENIIISRNKYNNNERIKKLFNNYKNIVREKLKEQNAENKNIIKNKEYKENDIETTNLKKTNEINNLIQNNYKNENIPTPNNINEDDASNIKNGFKDEVMRRYKLKNIFKIELNILRKYFMRFYYKGIYKQVLSSIGQNMNSSFEDEYWASSKLLSRIRPKKRNLNTNKNKETNEIQEKCQKENKETPKINAKKKIGNIFDELNEYIESDKNNRIEENAENEECSDDDDLEKNNKNEESKKNEEKKEKELHEFEEIETPQRRFLTSKNLNLRKMLSLKNKISKDLNKKYFSRLAYVCDLIRIRKKLIEYKKKKNLPINTTKKSHPKNDDGWSSENDSWSD